ncbi:MFS transporter [Nocardioides marmoriginsengisoli]|uniref:MFS transporter n=2 Tax=Nocardioides marmoriginsengisoli TaxID=661483 RepID=A0A3N0CHJ3_9ACTN|nr:MFS transporter [Nocardioides marmoriginsengisoli]
MLGVLLGMTTLGSTGVPLVLPTIAHHFDVGFGDAAWMVTSCALLIAVGAAIYGRLADLFGIRIPFLIGMVLYVAGSVGAVVAPTFGLLLVARIAHSMGAAALPVLIPALITGLFEGEARQRALARSHAIAIVLGALGPVLGGVIGGLLGWRAVMALPLLGAPAFVVLWRWLNLRGTGARFDVVGAVLVSVAAAGAVLILQSAASGLMAACAGVALLLLCLPFVVVHVRRHPDGFLPLLVVRNRLIRRSALGASPVIAAWFTLLITVPAALASQGRPSWTVGLFLLPGFLVALTMPRLVSRMLVELGAYRSLLLAAATATLALGLAVAGDLVDSSGALAPILLVAAFCLIILAISLGPPALASAVAGAVDARVRGVALGTSNLMFAVGGSLGAAVVGGLVEPLGTAAAVGLVAAASGVGLVSLSISRRVSRDGATMRGSIIELETS